MYYNSYREYDHSLTFEDKNRLFEGEHYKLEPNTFLPNEPSPWAPGQRLHVDLPKLLQLAKSSHKDPKFQQAWKILKESSTALGQLIAECEKYEPA